MLHLQGRELRIDLLDPAADAARLGPRFCGGGYIWQVHDPIAGPLLTGPEWPAPDPLAFNGQGLPESFRHRRLEGTPLTWRDGRGVALGAGELGLTATGDVLITEPCVWEITRTENQFVFQTRHQAAGYSYELQRAIVLEGRELRSVTRLTNHASDSLRTEWFAHPFFALRNGVATSVVPESATLAENAGFALTHGRLTQKRIFQHQTDGHMERSFQLTARQPLVATLAHPALVGVEFETSFAPTSYVIWGNDRTFSLEPYLALDLAPGKTREWSLRYRFGPVETVHP